MNEQTPFDAGDAVQVKERRKKLSLAERKRADIVRAVWGTAQGRAYCWELLADARVFQGPHVPGDPFATAFNAGSQNLGLKLLAEVQAVCPELYLQAMKEANEKDAKDE